MMLINNTEDTAKYIKRNKSWNKQQTEEIGWTDSQDKEFKMKGNLNCVALKRAIADDDIVIRY